MSGQHPVRPNFVRLGQTIFRFYLAAILGVGGIAKLFGFEGFVSFLRDHLELAPMILHPFAAILIGLELITAALLCFNASTRLGAILALLLSASFVLYDIHRPGTVCPCFGAVSSHLNLTRGLATSFRLSLFFASFLLVIVPINTYPGRRGTWLNNTVDPGARPIS